MSYNVLVVDDSPLARKMIVRSLKLAEVDVGTVHEASNGEEALELLAHNWVDIVFADINMPKMNGIALIEKMASDKMLEKVPVVIVSTERSEARIEHLRNLGTRAYLAKPFRPEAVRDVVAQLLKPAGDSHA